LTGSVEARIQHRNRRNGGRKINERREEGGGKKRRIGGVLHRDEIGEALTEHCSTRRSCNKKKKGSEIENKGRSTQTNIKKDNTEKERKTDMRNQKHSFVYFSNFHSNSLIFLCSVGRCKPSESIGSRRDSRPESQRWSGPYHRQNSRKSWGKSLNESRYQNLRYQTLRTEKRGRETKEEGR
jgi:hypothetical protein